jgi:hypothetical protein
MDYDKLLKDIYGIAYAACQLCPCVATCGLEVLSADYVAKGIQDPKAMLKIVNMTRESVKLLNSRGFTNTTMLDKVLQQLIEVEADVSKW